MALATAAAARHPLDDSAPYDEICQERVLAVQILKQAAEDLHFPARREEAREFLLERFWTSWWHDLLPSLSRTAVTLYTHTVLTQPARKVDADLKAPAPTRALAHAAGQHPADGHVGVRPHHEHVRRAAARRVSHVPAAPHGGAVDFRSRA